MPSGGKNSKVISLGAGGGGTGTPDSSTDPHIPKKVGTSFVNSALREEGDTVYCSKLFETESASLAIGPGATISDISAFLQVESNMTGRKFVLLDYQTEDTGSSVPLFGKRLSKETRVVLQPVDSTQMIGVTSYTVNPIFQADISRVYLKLVNPVTNFRAVVMSDVTGKPVKYFPSRDAFVNNTGVSLTAGENSLDFPSALAEVPTYPITVLVYADQPIDVLGDGVLPWRAVDRKLIIDLPMVVEQNSTMQAIMHEDSTKVYTGAELTADGVLGVATTFSLAPATLFLFDVPYTDDLSSSSAFSYSGDTLVAPLYTMPELNYISVKKTGNDGELVIRNRQQTNAERRDETLTGIVAFDGLVITAAVSVKNCFAQVGNQMIDFMRAVGNLKVDGLRVGPAAADLTINHTEGLTFGNSINATLNQKDPHTKLVPAKNPITVMSQYLGDGTLVTNVLAAIDPVNYNPNGGAVYEAVPGGPNTAQIIKLYIRPETNTVIYLPGQQTYNSISSALTEFPAYKPLVPDDVSLGSIPIAYVVVRKGAANLSLEDDVVFINAGKFGDTDAVTQPASDIAPTPLNGNEVKYNLALNQLEDSGKLAGTGAISGTTTIDAGVLVARYITSVALVNYDITLPVGVAGMIYEFVDDGSWTALAPNASIVYTEGGDTYHRRLTPQLDIRDTEFTAYVFAHNGTKWGVFNNG